MTPVNAMKRVGLVGGISWVSTIDYYRLINERVNAQRGGLHFAECLIYSLDFAAVQDLGWDNAYEPLRRACASLRDGGAEAIALCANTAHLHVERLEAEIGLPFVNLLASVAHAARERDLRRVALLGTKVTMEHPFYRGGLEQAGLEVMVPPSQDTRDFIQYTVKEELGRGIVREETRRDYITIVEELVKEGAEAVILGCTEIPMLLGPDDASVPVLDSLKIHVEAIVEYALSSHATTPR